MTVTMVDELWAAFVVSLPDAVRHTASQFAHLLKLCPARDTPWSQVFSHEVTLAAPSLLTEGMPDVPIDVIRDAALAHMLAVLDAFGTDRILDRQVTPTAAMEAVLVHARHARDTALARVLDGTASSSAKEGITGLATYAAAERSTLTAIEAERERLTSGQAVEGEENEGKKKKKRI